MICWLRRIHIDTFETSVAKVKTPWSWANGAVLERVDGAWRARSLLPRQSIVVNGRATRGRVLSEGDWFLVGRELHVVLTHPVARSPAELIAHLDERPDDETAIKVWADWLLEHGDPLGEHLLGSEPQAWVLEGTPTDAMELTWHHGLITRAVIRCTPTADLALERIARLLSTRVMRWVRELTIDYTTWDGSVRAPQAALGSLLRLLSRRVHLPALRQLGAGVMLTAPEPTLAMAQLPQLLKARFPHLETDLDALVLPTPNPVLEIEHVPGELDFYAPHARGGRFALTDGAWVGSASRGQLRLLTRGVHRAGVTERFLIEQTEARISLMPVDGVRLNHRPAQETRLIDGDLIETAEGARFRFRAR